MRVTVYEYLTAEGIGLDPASPDHGMYREGRAMRDALVADLGVVPDVEVVEGGADFVFVIAPETGSILRRKVEVFRQFHTVVASTSDAIALATDKLALAEHWRRHGVPTPHATDAIDWPSARVPAVVKPRDGAGSCQTYLCEDAATFRRLVLTTREEPNAEFIAQDYVPGIAASVAFLVGPRQVLPLQPAAQHLSADGRFQYLGGELPLPAPLASRAVALGQQAIACVGGLAGFVGVDLILGETRDWAIEINPRLTTSYVGLRRLANGNLAAAILDVFAGRIVEPLTWKSTWLFFDKTGVVRVKHG